MKTLYKKHSKKLPRSVRVYRTGATNSKDNDTGLDIPNNQDHHTEKLDANNFEDTKSRKTRIHTLAPDQNHWVLIVGYLWVRESPA